MLTSAATCEYDEHVRFEDGKEFKQLHPSEAAMDVLVYLLNSILGAVSYMAIH